MLCIKMSLLCRIGSYNMLKGMHETDNKGIALIDANNSSAQDHNQLDDIIDLEILLSFSIYGHIRKRFFALV